MPHSCKVEDSLQDTMLISNTDANVPSQKKMPPIQVSLLLHRLLSYLKRLRVLGDKLWKLGLRQVAFLRSFFQRCLFLLIGRFRNLNQISKSNASRPSMPLDKVANHDSHGVFGDVDCFSSIPLSICSGHQQRSQPLLPLHSDPRYRAAPQTDPSTSQAIVPYLTTPTGDVFELPYHAEHCSQPEPQTGPSSLVTHSITPQINTSLSSLSVATKVEDDRDPPSPPGLSSEILKLVGVTSSEFERYERNFKSEKIYHGLFKIDPLSMNFKEPKARNGWTAFTHPEGAPYFLDDSRTIPILTDVWVYDTADNDRLETYITQIFSYIKNYEIVIPKETCLVLEFRNSGNCGYYFVNHAKQCLFWLDEFNGMDFLKVVKVKYTLSLVGHEMKSLYWLHNYLFPNIRPLPCGAISEIKDVLIHAIGDSLTSRQSLAPYSLEVLQKMLDLVNTIGAQHEVAAGSIAIISRFLQNFYHERFLHLHGQKIARLNRGQSIHPEIPRNFLIKVMSFFLAYGPAIYLNKLREITVDCLVNEFVWRDLLEQLTADWKEFILYATVLLNANVAFLAIQSVDSSAPVGHRSYTQRASYLSIVASVGTIVLGLLLVKIHNIPLNPSFIANRSASMYGLETLALIYSLPYAFLIFALICFLVAFCSMCFGSHDQNTIIMMSITLSTLCLLLLWCISLSYEPFWCHWPSRLWIRFKESIKKGIMVGKGKIIDGVQSRHESSISSESPQP